MDRVGAFPHLPHSEFLTVRSNLRSSSMCQPLSHNSPTTLLLRLSHAAGERTVRAQSSVLAKIEIGLVPSNGVRHDVGSPHIPQPDRRARCFLEARLARELCAKQC